MKSIFKSKPKTPSDLVRQMRDFLDLSGTEGKESRRDEKQGNFAPTTKINTPIPGLTVVASGVSNITPVAVDVAARYGRHNKKSKWDKVDVNQRNFNPSGGQETLFAIGAHSSLKLVVDTLLLRNRGEMKQKIGDPVKEIWRKNHSVDSCYKYRDGRSGAESNLTYYAEKQLKSMQQVEEDHTLTQLANAWLNLAVVLQRYKKHIRFSRTSQKSIK